MANRSELATTSMSYPNITWPQFAVCNEDQRSSFEAMTRRLFHYEYLKKEEMPHSDHANPGVEVVPILEPIHADGSPQKRISFQSKYFDQSSADYAQIQKSAKQAIKHYKGNLDLIYLFCNKTLTTTSKGYKATEEILSDAGIKLCPISDGEVLDLIAKHLAIANYFFRSRTMADDSQPANISTGITIDSVTGAITISREAFQQPSINAELLKELVAEKVRTCKSHVLALELDELKTELDKLFAYYIDDAEGAGTLYYYKLLFHLHAGEDVEDCLEKSSSDYREEAKWLIELYKSPVDISADEFKRHTPEAQVFALDKLFTSRHWNCIVGLYRVVKDNADSSICTQLELHYGLALFNLQEYDQASEVLHSLFERTKEPRIQLYSVFADIQRINGGYRSGSNGDKEGLITLFGQFEEFTCMKQYKRQELLVAVLKLEASYYLGLSDKSYLECAIEGYGNYSETTKENMVVKYYYAQCLVLNGDRNKAVSVYAELDWRIDETIATRYMTALILSGDPSAALSVYKDLESSARSTRSEAIYLLALGNSGDETYRDALVSAVETHSESLEDFIAIAYNVEDKAAAKEIVIPVLKTLLNNEVLNSLQLYQKSELLTILAHSGEVELLEIVLQTISDLATINSFVVGEIYKALFEVANREYVTHDERFLMPEDLESVDRIAGRFLEANVSKKIFLQIKVLCSSAKQMPFSMLKYSKELFEMTHDEEMARNIVALLFNRNETDPVKYSPYLEALEKSESPNHCMAVASAMLKLGREEAAEFYAYKALYILNGENDYSVFKSYFGFCGYNMHRYYQHEQIRSVRSNMVVLLEESNPEGEPKRLEFCLDSESEFFDENNRSLNVEHITSSNPIYIKLRGSGLRQVLKLCDKNYRIVQIMPRSQYGLRYIFRKINENPELFKETAWMISTGNIDEMIEQIKSLTDRTEQTQSLLQAYHFEKNDVGLPIDAVAFGDYERYVQALKFLLYKTDQALYAGKPVYENETGKQYVPALSTLVLLSIIGKLDVLDAFKTELMIPESYHTFFREQYSKAIGMDQLSTESLITIDGQLVIQESDRTIPEIWEAIVTFCESCDTRTITDEERISFKFADELTGERFVSGFKLSSIHLDALLLAVREKATYLCDDLFFRKVANWVNVRNLNFVSLLEHYSNLDYMVPIIMELSKTNYLYIPLLARDDQEAKELYQNVLTGEKKRRYYGEVLRNYYEATPNPLPCGSTGYRAGILRSSFQLPPKISKTPYPDSF